MTSSSQRRTTLYCQQQRLRSNRFPASLMVVWLSSLVVRHGAIAYPTMEAFVTLGRRRHAAGSSSWLLYTTPSQTKDITSETASAFTCGLYRPIANQIWKTVLDFTENNHGSGSLIPLDIPDHLQQQVATSQRGPIPTQTKITTRAYQCISNKDSSNKGSIAYARMALLETTPLTDDNQNQNDVDSSSSQPCASGIQVLNFVIFPHASTDLPVWGADFVSLPGNKHLLLLDAQPMNGGLGETTTVDDNGNRYASYWNDWYVQHDIAKRFPWGGDMPEPVQQYVSPNALWTRFVVKAEKEDGAEEIPVGDPVDQIQGPLVTATLEHLKIYLELLQTKCGSATDQPNAQKDYVKYRLENDPARPMLNRLYGEEWAQEVLSQVLFPSIE